MGEVKTEGEGKEGGRTAGRGHRGGEREEKREASKYSKAQVMAEEEKIRSRGGSDGR